MSTPEALEMYLKALEISRAALGDRHPDVAGSYNNIAIVYHARGEHAKALEMLHSKALEIRRAALGERAPRRRPSYNNIAAVHRDQGEHARALELYGHALVALGMASERTRSAGVAGRPIDDLPRPRPQSSWHAAGSGNSAAAPTRPPASAPPWPTTGRPPTPWTGSATLPHHDEDKVRKAEDVSDLFPRAVGASARLAAASGSADAAGGGVRVRRAGGRPRLPGGAGPLPGLGRRPGRPRHARRGGPPGRRDPRARRPDRPGAGQALREAGPGGRRAAVPRPQAGRGGVAGPGRPDGARVARSTRP